MEGGGERWWKRYLWGQLQWNEVSRRRSRWWAWWKGPRSKLAAAILGGVDEIWIKPGARVLYLGVASGATVSHASDVVGPFHRIVWNCVNHAHDEVTRIPLQDSMGDAKLEYSDASEFKARILALNASFSLKAGGHFVISIKANCIDYTVPAETVFAQEVNKLQAEQFKPSEQVTLEPFEWDHAYVVSGYRMPQKQKPTA